MKRQGESRTWYTRREGVVRGPFPAGEITRYILLGRIRLDDELSRNLSTWSPAKTLTGLLPHEMLKLSSWDDYQRYIEARMRVDERRSDRRSGNCPHCNSGPGERRVLKDRRRRADDQHMIERYVFGFHGLDARAGGNPFRLRTLLLTLLLATLVIAWLVPVSR